MSASATAALTTAAASSVALTTAMPWWLVVPPALVIAWALIRLSREELSGLPAFTRRGLLGLRGLSVALVVLMVMQPSCSWQRSERDPAPVALVVDVSASMGVRDGGMSAGRRLDEATALGLVPETARDTAPRRTAAALSALRVDLPALASGSGQPEVHAAVLAPLVQTLAGHDDLGRQVADVVSRLNEVISTSATSAAVVDPANANALSDRSRRQAAARTRLAALADQLPALIQRLRQAQTGADASRASATDPELASSLAAVDAMSRLERALSIADRVRSRLGDRAAVTVHRLDAGLTPIPKRGTPAQRSAALLGGLDFTTDHAAPLRSLAERSAMPAERSGGPAERSGGPAERSAMPAERSGGDLPQAVLVIGDGRDTAGSDAAPAARALRSRGCIVHALCLGDDQPPRDAVVAAIEGGAEYFRGETVCLDVRLRLSVAADEAWDVVLARDGEVIERRRVKPTGDWQRERFEFPADRGGVWAIEARLEPGRADTAIGHGLRREVWTTGDLPTLDRLDASGAPPRAPDSVATVATATDPPETAGTSYRRLTGWLTPPTTGDYRIQISAGGPAEVWLATSAAAADRRRVASCPKDVEPGVFDRHHEQTSAAIALRAGERYWIEVRHRPTRPDRLCSVGWRRPDNGTDRPIPTEYLLLANSEPDRAGTDRAAATVLSQATRDNDAARIAIAVHEDPLRVLVVDNQPRWESRFIASLLERDRRVQVVRRYRSIRLPRGEAELLPDSQEGLDRFDAVVLGDLRPDELQPGDAARLSSFVRRRGGFLVCLAGERAMPGMWLLSPLAEVLPVRSAPPATGSGRDAPETRESPGKTPAAANGESRLRLTIAGESNPITAILDDRRLNQRLWPALPAMARIAREVNAKTAAEVLVETDERQPVPVVAILRAGAGRVLWLGSDESFRWRDRVGERVHQSFWLQATRWGLAARLRGSDERLQVALDRAVIDPGEAVELRARTVLPGGAAVTTTPSVELVRLGDDGVPEPATRRVMQLSALDDATGQWRQTLAGLPPGRWRVRVTCEQQDLRGLVEERTLLVQDRPGRETVDLRCDLAQLSRIAEAGGGKAVEAADLDALADTIAKSLVPLERTHRRTISVWDGWWVIALISLLLGSEWLWRRRVGLP